LAGGRVLEIWQWRRVCRFIKYEAAQTGVFAELAEALKHRVMPQGYLSGMGRVSFPGFGEI